MTTTSAPYVAVVRHYHPQGWVTGFYAGCTKRDGGKRMTDVCSHQHPTQGKAQTCADRLTAIRNGTSSCPTCGVPQHLPCVNPDTGREVPDHADRPAPIPGYKR